jgi:hypothetical protein
MSPFQNRLPFFQVGEKPIRISAETRAELSKAIGEKGFLPFLQIIWELIFLKKMFFHHK